MHHIISRSATVPKSLTTRWIPKHITSDLKEFCENVCETLWPYFEAERDDFLPSIVTRVQCWVHYFQSGAQQASNERRHSSSLKANNFCATDSGQKLMCTLFVNYSLPTIILTVICPSPTVFISVSKTSVPILLGSSKYF